MLSAAKHLLFLIKHSRAHDVNRVATSPGARKYA